MSCEITRQQKIGEWIDVIQVKESRITVQLTQIYLDFEYNLPETILKCLILKQDQWSY